MIARWARDRRERRYWEDLLARFGIPDVTVQEVTPAEDGVQVHVRPDRAAARRPHWNAELRDLGPRLAVQKRLPRDAVRIEDEPADAGGFVICVRTGGS
jgi:hypothetical protein